jgi:chromosome segregation ATPase
MTPDPSDAATPEIAKQSDELVGHLRTLQDDISAQLGEKREKLTALSRATERMNELQEQLKDLQTMQLEWAANREERIPETDHPGESEETFPIARPRLANKLRKAYEDLRQPRITPAPLSERTFGTADNDGNRVELRDPSSAASAELGSLRVGQRQWTADRESMLEDPQAVAGRLTQLAQDFQWIQTHLSVDRANLQTEVAQLKLDLQVSIEHAEAQRNDLLNEIGRLEQDLRRQDAALAAETRLRQADREEAQRQLAELERVDQERIELKDERSALLAKVQSLEYDLQVRQASYEAERDQLRDQSAALSNSLSALRSDHRQLAIDHEAVLQAQAATVSRHRELQQESQATQARLSAEKTKLQTQLLEVEKQLQADREQLELLRASWHDWQNERERLIADRTQLEQESQAREAAFDAERKLRHTQLENVRRRVGELETIEEGRLRQERGRRAEAHQQPGGISGSDASRG